MAIPLNDAPPITMATLPVNLFLAEVEGRNCPPNYYGMDGTKNDLDKPPIPKGKGGVHVYTLMMTLKIDLKIE